MGSANFTTLFYAIFANIALLRAAFIPFPGKLCRLSRPDIPIRNSYGFVFTCSNEKSPTDRIFGRWKIKRPSAKEQSKITTTTTSENILQHPYHSFGQEELKQVCPQGGYPVSSCRYYGKCGLGYYCEPTMRMCCVGQQPTTTWTPPTTKTCTPPTTTTTKPPLVRIAAPRCDDGVPPLTTCINGQCPMTYECDPKHNHCCLINKVLRRKAKTTQTPISPSTTTAQTQTVTFPLICASGLKPVGACVDSATQCPAYSVCIRGLCCANSYRFGVTSDIPQSATTTDNGSPAAEIKFATNDKTRPVSINATIYITHMNASAVFPTKQEMANAAQPTPHSVNKGLIDLVKILTGGGPST